MNRILNLLTSLNKWGLIRPIGVNQDDVVVYGYSRLEAAKRLGWKRIAVWRIKTDSDDHIKALGIMENLYRSEYTPEAKARIRKWVQEHYPDELDELEKDLEKGD